MITLKDKKDCCGCSACLSVCSNKAISFQEDNEGFLYPIVNKSLCNDCGLCNKVCPVLYYRELPKKASPIVYAAVNKNIDEYMNSSSGGVFIVLADKIIEEGGVVFGAIYDDKFNVVHSYSETKEGCKEFQKSKYTQSEIRGVYKQIKEYLKKGRKVLFSGTPCQVAGLKLYLMKQYDNLLTVDIVCHGVPSPEIFRTYLKFVGNGKNVKAIDFKTKNPNNRSTGLSIGLDDGTRYENRLITRVWNNLQFSNCIERPSCYDCQFTHLNRPGDITLGDYWHYDKVSPEFYPNQAPSLVLINTDKGNKLFDEIKGELFVELSDIKSCLQPNLKHPTTRSSNRDDFWKTYTTSSFKKTLNKYTTYSLKNRIIDYLKHSFLINICKLLFIKQFRVGKQI